MRLSNGVGQDVFVGAESVGVFKPNRFSGGGLGSRVRNALGNMGAPLRGVQVGLRGEILQAVAHARSLLADSGDRSVVFMVEWSNLPAGLFFYNLAGDWCVQVVD